MNTGSDNALFDSAVADVHAWLDEICDELGWTERRDALHAMRAAMHVLRDRLSVEQSAHLSAQLPTIVRGIYFEGWRPGHAAEKDRTIDDYLAHVAAQFDARGGDADAFEIARSVYAVLSRRISEGEVRKLEASLPSALRTLWGHT